MMKMMKIQIVANLVSLNECVKNYINYIISTIYIYYMHIIIIFIIIYFL
jgi:hypothetical protein